MLYGLWMGYIVYVCVITFGVYCGFGVCVVVHEYVMQMLYILANVCFNLLQQSKWN